MSRFNVLGVDVQAITCGGCGAVHAIPAAKYDACKEEGGFWTCPNGCSRGFREGQKEKEAVRRERDRLKQEAARLAEEIQAAHRKTERAEAKLRKHQRRVAAGVCPCCNRTFAKLAMHMKSKHPTFNVVPLKAAST